MLPILSIFIGRGIVFIKDLDWAKTFLSKKIGRSIVFIAVFVFIGRYLGYAYAVPKGYQHIVETGKIVKSIANEDDLIVASSAGGSQALYYCDRKGWPLLLPGDDKAKTQEAIDKLSQFIEKGAAYYVCPVMSEFNQSLLFKKHMFSNYSVVEHKPGKYIIFSLSKSK